jgi:secondary thiamine-phosphate synthase enzyme
VKTEELSIRTGSRHLVDITSEVDEFCRRVSRLADTSATRQQSAAGLGSPLHQPSRPEGGEGGGKHGDGLVHVFAPHATAGLALMETGAGTEPDVEELLARLLPRDDRYTHRHGSPGHGADHLLPVLVSPSLVLPVIEGRLALGTWQSVVLVDLNEDNPNRTVRLSFIGA